MPAYYEPSGRNLRGRDIACGWIVFVAFLLGLLVLA